MCVIFEFSQVFLTQQKSTCYHTDLLGFWVEYDEWTHNHFVFFFGFILKAYNLNTFSRAQKILCMTLYRIFHLLMVVSFSRFHCFIWLVIKCWIAHKMAKMKIPACAIQTLSLQVLVSMLVYDFIFHLVSVKSFKGMWKLKAWVQLQRAEASQNFNQHRKFFCWAIYKHRLLLQGQTYVHNTINQLRLH